MDMEEMDGWHGHGDMLSYDFASPLSPSTAFPALFSISRRLSHSVTHAACHRDHGITVISRPSLLTVRSLDSRGGAKQAYSLTGPIDDCDSAK
jgi:hypothetical protein